MNTNNKAMNRYFTFLYISILPVMCFSLNAQIPTDGLIVFCPFNGNANDESGNGLHGTVFGATLSTDRCNIDSNAYSFNGINDDIYVGDITSLDGSNAFSLSVWIYSEGTTDDLAGTIISKYNANGDSERVFIFHLYPQNNLRFCLYGADGNGDFDEQITSDPIPLAQWNHLVVNWDGLSHNIDIYVNGVEAASYYTGLGNNPTRIYNKSSPLMIGCSDFGYTSPDYMFNGSIDDLRIYNRELTFDEILSLFYSNCLISGINGENEVCQGQQNVNYSIQPITNIDYSWTYSGTGVIISGNSENVSLDFADNSSSGDLSVTVSGDNIPTQTSSLPIVVNSLPGNAGIITGDQLVCQDQGLNYSVSAIGSATNYNWRYSGTGATIVGDSNTVLIYFNEDASSGNIVVEGMNNCGNGMQSPDLPISVRSCNEEPQPFDVVIPNAFSPNADGINDLFVINGLPENTQLNIFNRTGKKLYTTDNYQNDWNGKDQYGNNLETGTYWYVIILEGIPTELKGFVYLKK